MNNYQFKPIKEIVDMKDVYNKVKEETAERERKAMEERERQRKAEMAIKTESETRGRAIHNINIMKAKYDKLQPDDYSLKLALFDDMLKVLDDCPEIADLRPGIEADKQALIKHIQDEDARKARDKSIIDAREAAKRELIDKHHLIMNGEVINRVQDALLQKVTAADLAKYAKLVFYRGMVEGNRMFTGMSNDSGLIEQRRDIARKMNMSPFDR